MRAVDLMLDSGAYSAWKRGTPIDLRKYIRFCERHRESLDSIVNLDVIPGAWGHVPSVVEINGTAALGYSNLAKMKRAELNPIPVYHQGEARYWLEKLIGDGYDYIGISPGNDRTTKQKLLWLDDVFDYLCAGKGYTRIRTHGFGVTALRLIYRYPWYSLDSTSWFLAGAFGEIIIPFSNGKGYDYTRQPYLVAVSERPDKKPSKSALVKGKHLNGSGLEAQRYIKRYLEQQEFDLDEARHVYGSRIRVNARFFKHLVEHYTPEPFHRRTRELIDTGSKLSNEGVSKYPWSHLRVIFTLNGSRINSQVLKDEGIRDQLLSYFMFSERDLFNIRRYVRTGIFKCKARPKR